MASAILTSVFMPFSVMAYSDKIIVGGENIGIHIETNGVMIIGFYKVNGGDIKSNPKLEIGDVITKVNGIDVVSIDDLTKTIDEQIKDNKVTLTFTRNNEEKTTEITLIDVDGVYKTGLYVKDGVTGIGTLTYIDPETKIFGTLGHEIIEGNSKQRVEVRTGTIFESDVTNIKPSEDGKAGEKNAKFNYDTTYGTIYENTTSGIFGNYEVTLPDKQLYEVGKKEDVKIGNASILTVVEGNKVEEFSIEITKINETNKIKNITFEITDEKLLAKTGGVVQGMSGSPIIQDGKIIGAVTHVIIDKVSTGYGIFIVTMLEEGEN